MTPLRAILFSLALSAATPALGEPDRLVDVYGELDISYDILHGDESRWQSNVSRFGLRGAYPLGVQTHLVYQVAQEIDPIRGGFDGDTLLHTRNTFIGVQDDRFGRLLFGTHDTPFKMAQAKIDLFNDQLGDIKSLVYGEVRARDAWLYQSPRFLTGIQARYMRVPADDDFGTSQSFSVSYDDDNIYWSVAADVDMRKNDQAAARTVVYDSVRTVTRFQVEKWRVGILLQTSRRGDIAGSDWEPGFVASLGRSFAAFDISAQYGQSDILVPGGRQTLLGISHHVARHLRLYAIASVYDSDSGNSEALSLGAEYKFSASLR